MNGRPAFAATTGLAAFAFVALAYAFAADNIAALSASGPAYAMGLAALLVVDGLFDLFLFHYAEGAQLRLKWVGFVVLAAVAYSAFSAAGAVAWPGALAPRTHNLLPVAVLALHTLVVRTLRFPVYCRGQLYAFLAENQKAPLMDLLNERRLLVEALYRQAKLLRYKAFSMLLLAFALVCANAFVGHVPWYLGAAFIALLAACLGLIGGANAILEEHRIFAYGTTVPERLKTRRQGALFVLIAVCLVPGALLGSDSAPLPHALGDLLAGLFRQGGVQPALPPNLAPPAAGQGDAPDLQFEAPRLPAAVHPPTIVPLLVKSALLAAAACLLLVYLLHRIRLYGIHPRRFLGRMVGALGELLVAPLRAFAAFLASLFAARPKREAAAAARLASPGAAEYARRLLRKAADNAGRPNQKRESLRLYVKFLAWAESAGARWTLGDPPFSIVEKTAAVLAGRIEAERLDGLRRDMAQLTELLERDLFSENALRPAELALMKAAVSSVVGLSARA